MEEKTSDPNPEEEPRTWNLSDGTSTDGSSDPNRPMSSAAAPASNLCTSERASSSSSSSSTYQFSGSQVQGVCFKL